MSSTFVSHIEVGVSDFVPSIDRQGELAPDLFQALIPSFHQHVKFALVEVLELDREVSMAKTWVYLGSSRSSDFDSLVTQYFSLIRQNFSDPTTSISSADCFYFGQKILFSRIDKASENEVADTSFQWHGPRTELLDRDYHESNQATQDDVVNAYQRYVTELSNSLLKQYRSSYILLVPVALNHRQPDRQRKVGAAFLHFGLNQPLSTSDDERRFARDVFRGINLYWHYNLTAESLYKQVRLAESATAEHALAKNVADIHRQRIDTYSEKILPLLERLDGIRGEIRRHIDPSALSAAKDALSSLSRLMASCFPATGPKHDPCGHTDLAELHKIGDQLSPWTQFFVEAGAFGPSLASKLLEPVTALLQARRGISVLNNSWSPHPALCLAKCISHNRLPLAWILYAVNYPCSSITTRHWQRYMLLATRDRNATILDVIYPLNIITEKLALSQPLLTEKSNIFTITLIPKWETDDGYDIFSERMQMELQAGTLPRGGTAIQLAHLLDHGCAVVLGLVDGNAKREVEIIRHKAAQATRIAIYRDRVILTLPTMQEQQRNTEGTMSL